MTSKKYSVVLLASLCIAALATFVVYRFIDARTAESRIATKPVVVAAKDVAEGTELKESDLRVELWPAPVVPEKAFDSPANVGGRVTRVAIYAGEAIVSGRLAPEGVVPGLESRIAPGKRAMGVRITDVSGISGMVQPNSRVDILLTLAADDESAVGTSILLMEDMRVLAMGSEVTRGTDGRVQPSAVATVEVTPAEAERLAAAQSRGSIQLVLRGSAEPGKPVSKNAGGKLADSVDALLRKVPTATAAKAPPRRVQAAIPRPEPVVVPTPLPPEPPPRVARPESLTIQVIRGATKSEEKLKKDSVKRDTIRP